MFLPVCLIEKLNASASNNSEFKECFDWKTKPNLKIVWPTLAAGTLGRGSQIDLEPGKVECRNDGPCLPWVLGITVASGKWPVPGNKAGVVQEDSVVSASCRCTCLAIISHSDATSFSLPQLCSQ